MSERRLNIRTLLQNLRGTLQTIGSILLGLGWSSAGVGNAGAQSFTYILDVPDYEWYAGCFGTATGNLMGYWDRNGFPNFYTGPTAGGVAPLDSRGGHVGIRSMWATKAGFDGRAADKPGHVDDYWAYYSSDYNGGYSYESTANDPYVTAGRAEHPADCLGDFIGLSQKKWMNKQQAGECNGNIDAYSFVFWETNGNRRVNYTATNAGVRVPDIQSGLREWTKFKGYGADTFTQLTDFNTNKPAANGFTWQDLKGEIDAGYPVLLFLQDFNELKRYRTPRDGGPPIPEGNPEIHGILAYGYHDDGSGTKRFIFKTSWGDTPQPYSYLPADWSASHWIGILQIRGVIGYHPKPKVTRIVREGTSTTIEWDGPSSLVYDAIAGETRAAHRYVVEKYTTIDSTNMVCVTPPTTERSVTLTDCCDATAFFRVRLKAPSEP